jgi:hypothetical protein
LRDAPGEECYAGATFALRWERLAEFAEEKIRINAREELFAILQAEQAQDSGGAGYGCESRALINF